MTLAEYLNALFTGEDNPSRNGDMDDVGGVTLEKFSFTNGTLILLKDFLDAVEDYLKAELYTDTKVSMETEKQQSGQVTCSKEGFNFLVQVRDLTEVDHTESCISVKMTRYKLN